MTSKSAPANPEGLRTTDTTDTDPLAFERRRADFTHSYFGEAIDNVVNRLRQTADEIERDRNRSSGTHGDRASNVVSSLSNLGINIRLDTLVRAAAEADAAQAVIDTLTPKEQQ